MSSAVSRRPSGLARFRQRLGSLLGRGSRFRRRVPGYGVFLLVLLTLLVGPSGPLTAWAAAAPGHAPAQAATLTPMTQAQALANQAHAFGHASGAPTGLGPFLATGTPTTPRQLTIPRQVVPPQPSASGTVTLSATTTTTLTTSDGRLSLVIPSGAVPSSTLLSAGGSVTLKVTQLSGPMGGGPSGLVSLGTYRIEVLGPKGRLTGFTFQQPLTLSLRYGPEAAGGFIEYGVLLTLQSDTPTRTDAIARGTTPTPAPEIVRMTAPGKTHTVSAQTMLAPLPLAGALVASFNTSAPQATWPTLQGFQTDLNSGSLTYSYPFDLPPAPGGFLPSLGASYASASVNEDHGLQTDAPWVGEGWSLDLGQITWSQVDENSGCQQHDGPYTVPCSSHNWQNVWNISASGISSALVPQNVNWATGPNSASDPLTSVPAIWYTAPETHARIIEINCTTTDLQNNSWTHPCWRVWLPSGELLEFGATNDSVEYYVDASNNKYIYGWKVDALVDTHGNQIHVSYHQYTGSYPVTNTPYVRDAELANVSYDAPTCQNASTICPTSGSAPNLWQPLVQVVFDQTTKPIRLAADSTCLNWASSTTRCDMATDASGGLPGPQVTSVGVLNDLQMQVRPSGTGSWNLLRGYAFSYEQHSGWSGYIDPASGEPENVAGYLDLTQIQEFGTDLGGSALLYSGKDNSSTSSFAYMKVFDVSSQHLLVSSNTTLSYWVFPESTASTSLVTGSDSTCVAVDMIFTDGSDLRDSGAVDQNGNQLHPAHQCGHLTLDQWNLVTSVIGAKVSGKTISRINIGYDQPANTGGYRGYFDDIRVTTGSTTLFSTGLESGQPQPTWTNTVDTSGGGSTNIGGICCGLTGPEAKVSTEINHWNGTTWPAMQFSYTGAARSTSTINCLSPGNYPCTDSSQLQERYLDPAFVGLPTSSGAYQCAVWLNFQGCVRVFSSETFNQRYLAEADNGMGEQETFSWQEGHMNVVGVPSGQSVTNPFSCTTSILNANPCWQADEQHWSRVLLVARDTKVQRTTNGGPVVTVDDHEAYTDTMATVQAQNAWCVSGVCPVVWDWGNVNDGDPLDYYNAQFRGFSQVQVVEQEIDTGGGACTTACTMSVENHFYITTQGWGVWDQNEVTNTTGVGCWNKEGSFNGQPQYLCPSSPAWASSNMPAGSETEVDQYAADGTTLLKKTLSSYTLNCAPPGDPSTPVPSWDSDGKWWTISPGTSGSPHLLVQELDQDNPTVVCDPQMTQQQTLFVDGGSVSGAPTTTVTYAYDTNQSYSGSHDYGNLTVTDTVASDGGSVGGSGNDLVQTSDYTVNDNITTTATSATGTYIVDTPYQKATRSGSASGTIQALMQDYYDGNTSLTAAPTKGDVTQESVAYSGTGPYTFLTTKYGYDSYGNLVGILKPNGQTGCTVGSTSYSACAMYDTSSYAAHVTQVTNALGQHPLTRAYGSGSAFGFGEWSQSDTDANSQAITYQFDALGRLTGITEPGEGTGLLTTQYVYSIWCPATGPSIPCGEMDTIQRYDSSTTVTTRTFYDGYGKVAGTRTPADGSNDVITYTTYDAREESIFTSRPYYVSAYTGGPGSAAYSAPDSTQLGSSTVYDALGRATQTTDPAGASTTTSYLQLTGPDSAVYQGTQVIDANHHQAATLTDALGRPRYAETFTGTSPYTLYATTSQAYDFQGHLVTITHPDGSHTTTFTYDLAGRKTGETDPDLGAVTLQLDADGNVTQQTDARGQTVYSGYDALDRQLWRNTSNTPTGAYVTYTYDGTVPSGVNCTGITPGSNAIGHVTTEQFTSGPGNSFSGSYCSGYDARGETLGQVDTLAGTTYAPILSTYNDAGVVTKLTFPTGEYEQPNFNAQERLTSITRSAQGTTNSLIPSITYTGPAGPSGKPDSYVIGGSGPCAAANSSIVCASLAYDADLRLTQATDTQPTGGTPITLYSLGVTYDAVGNVTSLSAALPAAGGQSGGQDNQQFCYDELNRLTWAGDTGTNPCTNQAVTGTTLTNASYTSSYTYDVSNRITQSTLSGALGSSPQGSYTYDSTHYHAVDAIGSSAYEAQYDASGNMTCRTTTGPQVCTGSSQTGATLTYDAEGRLIQWTSADGSTTVKYGYDGEGHRFEMQVTSSGTTTTTTYLGSLEEVQSVGGTTTPIVYYSFMGQQVAEDDNGHWYYLLNDQLTSTSVVVDATGVIAAQLFAPYGQTRWAGGTMPTSYAFTGQRSDSATGLDYYGARYYDPEAGAFTSADTAGGLNRYAYVAGNPETLTDPTGHMPCAGPGGPCGGGGGGSGSGPIHSIPIHHDPIHPTPPRGGGGGSGGGGGGGSGHRHGGSSAMVSSGDCDLSCQIVHNFSEGRTQHVLELMLLSVFGTQVVEFLLQYLAYEAGTWATAGRVFTDKNLIQWNYGSGGFAGGNDGAVIVLSGRQDNVSAAGSIAHEAVEVYFAQADGVSGKTLPMDYVADTYGMMVQNAIGYRTGHYGMYYSALDLGYRQWYGDYKSGGGGPIYRAIGYGLDPDTLQHFLGWSWSKGDNVFLGNPMHLSLSELNWEDGPDGNSPLSNSTLINH